MVQWYEEADGEGLKSCYAYDQVLFDGQSPYQTVKVLNTREWGRMLVIDDFVMLTDKDEFVYHEMIAHVPVCYHPNPEVIVVIGGGDGGTVRELVKHKEVRKIVLCEIDEMVVDASKKFFPKVASALDDPRVEIRIGDGIEFVKESEQFADLMIIDSTDPIGPGEGLFTSEFYRSVRRALRSGGMMVAQSESPWAPAEFLRRIHKNISGGFSHIMPYVAPIPTYPRGFWSWTIGATERVIDRPFHQERFDAVRDSCEFLTESCLRSAFDLPPFFRKKIERI